MEYTFNTLLDLFIYFFKVIPGQVIHNRLPSFRESKARGLKRTQEDAKRPKKPIYRGSVTQVRGRDRTQEDPKRPKKPVYRGSVTKAKGRQLLP